MALLGVAHSETRLRVHAISTPNLKLGLVASTPGLSQRGGETKTISLDRRAAKGEIPNTIPKLISYRHPPGRARG